MSRLLLAALAMGVLAAPASAQSPPSFAERFGAACETGPVVELLLGRSFSAEKTRSGFCSCVVEAAGDVQGPAGDALVWALENLDSNPEDQTAFAEEGARIEQAFDACVASQGLTPPRD